MHSAGQESRYEQNLAAVVVGWFSEDKTMWEPQHRFGMHNSMTNRSVARRVDGGVADGVGWGENCVIRYGVYDERSTPPGVSQDGPRVRERKVRGDAAPLGADGMQYCTVSHSVGREPETVGE